MPRNIRIQRGQRSAEGAEPAVTQDSPGARKDGGSGTLPGLDTGVANAARMWNYWIGGKDNISQAASRCPDSGRTVTIQARHERFSNMGAIAVRVLSCTSM